MPSMTKQFVCAVGLALTPELKKSLAVGLADNSISTMSDSDLRSYLSPSPEDYVMIPFRALSASAVQGNTLNFGHNDGEALKKAVPMFNGLIVLKDHDQTVDNWLGKTQDSYWDTSLPDSPPGINFMLKIDTKADPKLARGLISGMVNSGSVTIQFDYEKSHPKMDDYEFYSQMGQTVKGKLVQALVTEVTRCFEYSIVWQGADSDAKVIRPDGTIDKSGLSLDTPEEHMLKKLALSLGLPETATETEVETALQAKLAAESAAVAAKLAADTQVATLTATVTARETELATKTTEHAVLQAQVVTLTAEKAAVDTEVAALKTRAAAFDAHVTARRAEAKRLYLLAEGDKAMEPLKQSIDHAQLDVAESFITTFGAKVEQLMPLACTKCGGVELSRRTSKQSQSGTTEDHTGDGAGADVRGTAHFATVVKGIHG